MDSKLISDIFKDIPFESKLRVGIQMELVNILADERGWERGEEYNQQVEDDLGKIYEDVNKIVNKLVPRILIDYDDCIANGASIRYKDK